MKQKYLLTYACVALGERAPTYGMAVSADPVKWLESTQEYPTETYFIINQLPITDAEAKRIDGELKGM